MTIALAPNCTQISGFGADWSITSREATFPGLVFAAVLKPIPTPIPKIKTPPRIAKEVELKAEDLEGLDGGLKPEALVSKGLDLRFIVTDYIASGWGLGMGQGFS